MHQLQNVNVVQRAFGDTRRSQTAAAAVVARGGDAQVPRTTVRAIERRDPRLFVVVGPLDTRRGRGPRICGAAWALAAEVESTLLLIMRVYFEKPCTTVGWKGLINDPDLDDSSARAALRRRAAAMAPKPDPIMPQYLSELITWTAIGARTTESQDAPENVSGLSTPVGFKNGTDEVMLATSINALQSVRHPHHFLGITQQGQSGAVFRTRGNAHAHLVAARRRRPGQLRRHQYRRGGTRRAGRGPSCRPPWSSIAATATPAARPESAAPGGRSNCIAQIVDGNRSIVGLMLESHLKAETDHPEGLEHPRIRHVHYRSLHRLAKHRELVAQGAPVLARRATLTRASVWRCFQRRYPSRSVRPQTYSSGSRMSFFTCHQKCQTPRVAIR